MKKVIALVITLSMLFLCGCEKHSDYKEIESRLFISALGVDETVNDITIYAESAVSKGSDDGYETTVLQGSGATIPEAFDGIKNSTPLSIDLSHLSVIILGKCQKNTEKKLAEYLLSKPEDMLSCYLVFSDSAKDLISLAKDTPIGYSLGNALKKNDYCGGKRTPSTLLDIINSAEAFSLPYFKADGEVFAFAGAVYYNGFKRLTIKDTTDSRLITLLSGRFLRGLITLNGNSFDIKSSSISQKITADRLLITLSLKLEGTPDTKILENELLRVLNEWQEDYKTNIFRFRNGGKTLTNAEFCEKEIHLALTLDK